MLIQGYQDLIAWQRSIDLIEEIYDLSRRFPAGERHVLTDQIRRAALSVSNNIAEGSGRGTTPDLLRFLSYSRGSVKETESMVIVGQRLRYIDASQGSRALGLTDEVSRLITGLRRSHSARYKRR